MAGEKYDFHKCAAEFIKKRCYGQDAQFAQELLCGSKPYSLEAKLAGDFGDEESLGAAIKDSVMSYSKDKDRLIGLYRRFLGFVNEKCRTNTEVAFPPVPISIKSERRMYIAKYFQEPGSRLEALEDILWTSQRTLNEDLYALQGNGEDRISICGKTFTIEGMERSRGAFTFASTAHPLFLTENITQVIALFKGLRYMETRPDFERYARASACEIWRQLSDYAKRRILFVSREIISEDAQWFCEIDAEVSLAEADGDTFRTERCCSSVDRCGALLECMKCGEPFCIEYDSPDGARLYTDCRLVPGSYRGDGLQVSCGGEVTDIEFDRVIRSSRTGDGII